MHAAEQFNFAGIRAGQTFTQISYRGCRLLPFGLRRPKHSPARTSRVEVIDGDHILIGLPGATCAQRRAGGLNVPSWTKYRVREGHMQPSNRTV